MHEYIQKPALKPFSSFRCFWDAASAADYAQCQGYLQATLLLRSLTFECEKPEIQSSSTRMSRAQHVGAGGKTIKAATRSAALDVLVPSLSFAVTVDRRVIFQSSGVILKNDVNSELSKLESSDDKNIPSQDEREIQQSSVALQSIEWIRVSRMLYKDTREGLGCGGEPIGEKPSRTNVEPFGIDKWTESFDIYHPNSIIGIHLISADQTVSFAADEILASRFLQAAQLPLQPETISLTFGFHFPVSNVADENFAITRRSRDCRVTLTLQLTLRFRSPLGSFPAFALDRPPTEVFRTGPDTPVRLLSVEFASPQIAVHGGGEAKELFPAYSDSCEDIQTTIKHTRLFLDILAFWLSHLHSLCEQILSWNRPILSTLVAVYVVFIISFPSFSYSLGLLLIPLLLSLTSKLDDPISPRIVELYSTSRRPKTMKFETTFQADKTQKDKEDKPASPMATEALTKTLIQSALSTELIQWSQYVRSFLITWLPNLVFIHCLLMWKSSSTEDSWRMKCYLENIQDKEQLNTDQDRGANELHSLTKETTTKEWQDTPFFESARYTPSRLRKLIPISPDSLLLCVACVVLSLICYPFTTRVLYAISVINLLWYTYTLTKYTTALVALKRAIRAIYLWLHAP